MDHPDRAAVHHRTDAVPHMTEAGGCLISRAIVLMKAKTKVERVQISADD